MVTPHKGSNATQLVWIRGNEKPCTPLQNVGQAGGNVGTLGRNQYPTGAGSILDLQPPQTAKGLGCVLQLSPSSSAAVVPGGRLALRGQEPRPSQRLSARSFLCHGLWSPALQGHQDVSPPRAGAKG